MRASSAIVLLVAAAAFVVRPASGLYFHIQESETKCFIEEVPDETMIVGTYKTQAQNPDGTYMASSPGFGIHVEVGYCPYRGDVRADGQRVAVPSGPAPKLARGRMCGWRDVLLSRSSLAVPWACGRSAFWTGCWRPYSCSSCRRSRTRTTISSCRRTTKVSAWLGSAQA